MSVVGQVILSLIAGLALGAFYFSVLWWMTHRLPHTRWPTALTVLALLVRFSVAIYVIALLAIHWGWPAVLASVAGFIAARTILIRRLGPKKGILVGRL